MARSSEKSLTEYHRKRDFDRTTEPAGGMMPVEDHPMEYNTFEGTIPAGEYGGGTVMLWDRGSYRPDEAKPGEDDETAVRRGLKAGKLSFTFDGERLQGSFALVRTDRGPKPKWLLIKHRDESRPTTTMPMTTASPSIRARHVDAAYTPGEKSEAFLRIDAHRR